MQFSQRILLFPLIFILLGCGAFTGSGASSIRASHEAEAPAFFVAAEWNLQALFDGQENGNEYGEYLESAGWTAEKYRARLVSISQALARIVPEGEQGIPDLIGFVELENAGVLEDLAQGDLSKYGYSWIAFANNPGSSLGVGFLSRYPITESRAHSITSGKETAPRPILEIRVEPGGKPLVFLLCHWKSKLGGDDKTEPLRRASARVIARRLRELKESEEETPVIVMGDLNENHDEFYRRNAISALLPDDPEAAVMAANAGATNDFLVLSGEKPPIASSFPEHIPVLHSPWYGGIEGGSFYYRDDWETIDHFLLSGELFNSSGWDYADCRTVNHAPFTRSDGAPNTYIPRNGMGLSDHLPLLLFLVLVQ